MDEQTRKEFEAFQKEVFASIRGVIKVAAVDAISHWDGENDRMILDRVNAVLDKINILVRKEVLETVNSAFNDPEARRLCARAHAKPPISH